MGKINKNISIKPFRRQQNHPTKKTQGTDKTKVALSSAALNKGKTKKAKRDLKKCTLINKLKKSGEAKEKIQRAKQKAQTPVVGNMDPLLDALSAIVDESGINLNASEHETHQKKTKKAKGHRAAGNTQNIKRKNKHPSEKARYHSNMRDMEIFQRVTTHPKFTGNPVNAISEHVKYLMQQEEDGVET
ncbi:uncharacterized protein [Clytia hemisphaerica]|uniref:uncharacterized protein n=1 Tax=Clytia hemisphaerica TaxID=252671 RepID=UPI0034D63004|eukprot:TCONS_00058499-protein